MKSEHREVQGHESKRFRAYFKEGIRLEIPMFSISIKRVCHVGLSA